MNKKQFFIRPFKEVGSFVRNCETYQTNNRKEAEEFASILLRREETIFIQVVYKNSSWGIIRDEKYISHTFDIIIDDYEEKKGS